MKPSIPAFLGSMLLGAALTAPAPAASPKGLSNPLRVAGPVEPISSAVRKLDASLEGATGTVQVIVQFKDAPLLGMVGENARRGAARLNRAQQMSYSASLRNKQAQIMNSIRALGGQEVARLRVVYNGAIVSIDASKLPQVAALPGVHTISRLGKYQIELSETVGQVGAAAVQAAGLTGKGIVVAVLDSGIDYTHRNFGGPGTVAAYEAAYGAGPGDPRNASRDGLFPTDKVIDGIDFVGEAWPNGPVSVDDDPIDFQGHGTHVADIIGGKSLDGEHVGVAPDVKLISIKVCSAVSTSCNGNAMLQGIEYAVDPNGDGSIDDAADIINMSIGQAYGQREDAISASAAAAVRAGIVVVTSAGNSGDRPHVVGSPSTTPEVISVAQTHVASATAIPLVVNSPPAIADTYGNTATIEWAPLPEEGDVTGDVIFAGRGCVTTLGDTLPAGLAGKIALIDRGSCNISEKVRGASDAGAAGVLIGLVAEGDAVTFASGPECLGVPAGTCKPTLVIQKVLADSIKGQLSGGNTVNVTYSNDFFLPLINSMASTSSRGPGYSFNTIKPDIGAPGASVSAEVGTGDGETPFGGTSGASPMVAGAVALLLEAFPNRSPAEIKSLLMNTAETEIFINDAALPGVLAPITRIGGGELRVDAAVASHTAAWDSKLNTGSLSFGFHSVSEVTVLKRRVTVRNYSNQHRIYNVGYTYRYDNDRKNGAVKLKMPKRVAVGPRGTASFDVVMTIDPTRLPVWQLNGGALGGTGSLLQTVEYDGYVTLEDSRDKIHLAWQVLPHKSAAVRALNDDVKLLGKLPGLLGLFNFSRVLTGRVDAFALTGTSPRIPKAQLPQDGDDFAVVDIESVGVRTTGSSIQFAISTYGRRAHPAYPAEFDIYIDTNGDQTADYALFNAENGGFDLTGQTVVQIVDLNAGVLLPQAFFADADLDSGNIIYSVPMSPLGISPDTQIAFDVLAFDNYFSGFLTDQVVGMVHTPGKPRYVMSGLPSNGIPPLRPVLATVNDLPANAKASPSQTGFLLMYRDAKQESERITVRKLGR